MDNEESVDHSLPSGIQKDASSPSRRQFMQQLSGITATSVMSPTAAIASTMQVFTNSSEEANPMLAPVKLRINGKEHSLTLDSRVTLLDALREYLRLTGTKKGCDHGACGACTVLVNGQRINSCLTLAVMHQQDEVTTIEGLASGENGRSVLAERRSPGNRTPATTRLHPVQAAFLEHDGFQCGYCTPGQIMSAVALVQEGHTGSDDEIREWMSGNICRCGAYNNIVGAIKSVRSAQ